MNAIFGYNYDLGKWEVLDVQVGPLTPSAETYERLLIKPGPYTAVVEAPILKGTLDGETATVTLADGYELPSVLTLEDSIRRNKKILSAY